MPQERIRRGPITPEPTVPEEVVREMHELQNSDANEQANERRSELDEETEKLLDEIDELLEPNAQDFIRDYVQKGGE